MSTGMTAVRRAVQDSNRAALTTPVGRGNNQPRGLLLSSRFPAARNVYRDDCGSVDGTGLEPGGCAVSGLQISLYRGCSFLGGCDILGSVQQIESCESK